jgi:hypothetical protein
VPGQLPEPPRFRHCLYRFLDPPPQLAEQAFQFLQWLHEALGLFVSTNTGMGGGVGGGLLFKLKIMFIIRLEVPDKLETLFTEFLLPNARLPSKMMHSSPSQSSRSSDSSGGTVCLPIVRSSPGGSFSTSSFVMP